MTILDREQISYYWLLEASKGGRDGKEEMATKRAT